LSAAASQLLDSWMMKKNIYPTAASHFFGMVKKTAAFY